MIDKIVLLVLGFILTGVLARIVQLWVWKYQWTKSQKEKRIELKLKVYEEISAILDKRIYRLKQLLWKSTKEVDETILNSVKDEYRSVVYEWNDNINRNLAFLEIYFSKAIRDRFDYDIGDKCVQLGAAVEAIDKNNMQAEDKMSIEKDISNLAGKVYSYNVELLNDIKHEQNTL